MEQLVIACGRCGQNYDLTGYEVDTQFQCACGETLYHPQHPARQPKAAGGLPPLTGGLPPLSGGMAGMPFPPPPSQLAPFPSLDAQSGAAAPSGLGGGMQGVPAASATSPSGHDPGISIGAMSAQDPQVTAAQPGFTMEEFLQMQSDSESSQVPEDAPYRAASERAASGPVASGASHGSMEAVGGSGAHSLSQSDSFASASGSFPGQAMKRRPARSSREQVPAVAGPAHEGHKPAPEPADGSFMPMPAASFGNDRTFEEPSSALNARRAASMQADLDQQMLDELNNDGIADVSAREERQDVLRSGEHHTGGGIRPRAGSSEALATPAPAAESSSSHGPPPFSALPRPRPVASDADGDAAESDAPEPLTERSEEADSTGSLESVEASHGDQPARSKSADKAPKGNGVGATKARSLSGVHPIAAEAQPDARRDGGDGAAYSLERSPSSAPKSVELSMDDLDAVVDEGDRIELELALKQRDAQLDQMRKDFRQLETDYKVLQGEMRESLALVQQQWGEIQTERGEAQEEVATLVEETLKLQDGLSQQIEQDQALLFEELLRVARQEWGAMQKATQDALELRLERMEGRISRLEAALEVDLPFESEDDED